MGLLGLIFAGATVAHAGTVSFSGVFTKDDDVQLFTYVVQADGDVNVKTTSYIGGGFQPILSVFDESKNFLFDNSGFGSAVDADLTWPSLANALYYIALTQYGNTAIQPTLDDSFKEVGNGNYTADIPYNNYTPGGSFLDPGGVQRTANWAVEFSSADPISAVELPEPATFPLLAGGVGALLFWRRRRLGA
jgi:hypothetical protein